jgi:hypothetical protein
MNRYEALHIIKESGLKLIKEENALGSKKNKRSNKKEENLIKSIGLSEFNLERGYFNRLKEIFDDESVSYDIDRDDFSIHVGEDLTVLFQTLRNVRVVCITNWGNGSGNFKTGDWVYLRDGRNPRVPVSEVTFDEIVSAIKSAKRSNSLNSEEAEENSEEEAFADRVWKIVASELTDSQFEDMEDYMGDLEDILLKHYDNGADEEEVAEAIIDKWSELTDYDFEDED